VKPDDPRLDTQKMLALDRTDPARRGWEHCSADEASDALVASLLSGGVDQLFFVSGSDILFFQEAIAKRIARGLAAPNLVTMLHEIPALNAALGYSMVSGKVAAVAVHVDVGTLNCGSALHTAWAGGYPVMLIAGSPARAYPGTMRGGRDHPIYWIQEPFDQRQLVRGYMKWMWRLEHTDNPGLVVSRAIQVALSHPRGPVFLSVPREVGMAAVEGDAQWFPPVELLGVTSPPAPDPDAIDRLAEWLLDAERPVIVTGRGGRNPDTVEWLVRVAELAGASVTDSRFRDRLNFPSRHPLFELGPGLADADLALVVDRRVPWVPEHEGAPSPECRVAWLAEDPIMTEVPVHEFRGDLRIMCEPARGLRALAETLADRVDAAARGRARERIAAGEARRRELDAASAESAERSAGSSPIDPRWVACHIGRLVDDEAILLDESLSSSRLLREYYGGGRPNAFFAQGGSAGGWGSGAALGAKLAEPGRDVILASGDGFYAFGVPSAALWTAVQLGAPYLAVVFVNASYSTGTTQVDEYYPDSYAAAAGYPGGRFNPPPDFAAEARSVGAHGESVSDPADVEPALQRGLAATRAGQPAVVAVHVA
jgi:acetolactate synthase-1/2/3 large subunit